MYLHSLFIRKSQFNQRYGQRKAKSETSLPRSFCVFCFILYSIPLGKCTAHSSHKLIWPIVFDLGVNVHSDFTVFMACQILDRFGVHRWMNQICDISMTQLVRCHFKIQAVNNFAIMGCFFSEDRCNRMLYALSIFIPVIAAFLNRSGNNILPKPLELRIRQWFTISIGNHIVRSGSCLCCS